LNISLSLQLHLFEAMSVPIILYGSQVWAMEDLQILDQCQMKFCKLVFNLKQSTPNCMIYDELGIKRVSLLAKVRSLTFWS